MPNKITIGTVAALLLVSTLGIFQPESRAQAAQGCSLNSFYGTVTYNGAVIDGANVTLKDTSKGSQILSTTTTNGGLYIIESANFDTCASPGDQITITASFNTSSALSQVQYTAQALTLVNLSIISATSTTTPTSTPTTTPSTPVPTTTPSTTIPTPTTPPTTPGGTVTPVFPYVMPSEGLSVTINDGEKKTERINVELKIFGGNDAQNMAVSNNPDFNGSSQEPYRTGKAWVLPSGNGPKTIYIKFYNSSGTPSPVISASITKTGPVDNKSDKSIPKGGILYRGNKSHRIYHIIEGKKQYIPTLMELKKYKNKKMYQVADFILARYPDKS